VFRFWSKDNIRGENRVNKAGHNGHLPIRLVPDDTLTLYPLQ
jgi:hypothetical protein